MSVVNKMLQDLEARQADGQPVQADYQPPAGKKPSKPFMVVAAVLVVAIVLLALDNFGAYDSQNTSEMPSQVATPSQPQSQPKPVDTAIAETTNVEHSAAEQPESTAAVTAQSAEFEDEENEIALSTISRIDALANETPLAQDSDIPTEVEKQPPQNDEAMPQGQFAMSDTSDVSTPARLKAEAKLALQEGENGRAVQALEALLEFEPDNLAARKRLAALYFSVGDTGNAERTLQQGLVLDDQNGELKLMLARLYSQQQQFDIAFSILQGQSVALIDGTDLLATRASLAERLTRFDDAREDYQTLVTMQPDNARWWLGLAVILERQKDYPLATRAYERAADLGQLSADVSRFIQQRLAFLAEAS